MKTDLVAILSQSVQALRAAFPVGSTPFCYQTDLNARLIMYHLSDYWRVLPSERTVVWDAALDRPFAMDIEVTLGDGYGFYRSDKGISIITCHAIGVNDTVYHVFSNANERPSHTYHGEEVASAKEEKKKKPKRIRASRKKVAAAVPPKIAAIGYRDNKRKAGPDVCNVDCAETNLCGHCGACGSHCRYTSKCTSLRLKKVINEAKAVAAAAAAAVEPSASPEF